MRRVPNGRFQAERRQLAKRVRAADWGFGCGLLKVRVSKIQRRALRRDLPAVRPECADLAKTTVCALWVETVDETLTIMNPGLHYRGAGRSRRKTAVFGLLLATLLLAVPSACWADRDEKALKAEIETFGVLTKAGQSAQALTQARSIVAFAQAHYPPDDEHVGSALIILSVALGNAGEDVAVLAPMEQAVAILEHHKKTNDVERLYFWGRLATLYLELDRPADAVTYYLKAVPLLDRYSSKADSGRALFFARLAAAYYALHQVAVAQDYLQRARTVLDQPKTAHDLLYVLALRIAGDAYGEEGRYGDTEQMFSRAVQVLDRLTDKNPPLRFLLLEGEGAALARLHRYDEANQVLQPAVSLSESVNGKDHATTADLVRSLAQSYFSQGRYAEAIALQLRAAASFEKTGGVQVAKAIGVYSDLTLSYTGIGEYALAIQAGERALQLCASQCGPDDHRPAHISINLGAAYFQAASFDRALPLLEHALSELKRLQIEPDRLTALAMNNLAMSYHWLGRSEEARLLETQALSMMSTLEAPDSPYLALMNDQLCVILTKLGQVDEAIAKGKESERILRARRADGTDAYARSQSNLGAAYTAAKNFPAALGALEQAVSVQAQALGEHTPKLGIILSNLSVPLLALGRMEEALAALHRALGIQTETLGTAHPDTALTLSNLGEAYARSGQPEVAIAYAKLSVNAYQSQRTRVAALGPEDLRSYTRTIEDTYKFLAGALTDQGRLSEAQAVLDMLKETEAFEFIRRSATQDPRTTQMAFGASEKRWANQYQQIADHLIEIGATAQALRRKQEQQALSENDAQELVRLDAELAVARTAFTAFLTQTRAAFEREGRGQNAQWSDVSDRSLRSLQQIIKTYPAGTVLLQYLLTEDKLRILLTTATAQIARSVVVDLKQLRQQIAQFRAELNDPNVPLGPTAEHLYDTILGPVQADLAQAKATTLMVGLDGALRYIPLTALRHQGRYVAEQWSVVLYVAAAKEQLRKPAMPLARLLGLGVTKASGDLRALPAAREEIQNVVATGSARRMVGESYFDDEFTAQRLKNASDGHFQVVHIASHFRFSPGTEANSYLLLGNDQRLTLGALRQQNYRFDNVDLLTLSACDTGLGGGYNAEGQEIEGFGVIAQEQGAHAVLATLWQVNDRSTSLFMQSMYRSRSAQSLDKAAALRSAQLALLAMPQYRHPYYWAPFVLMGNWR